MADTLGIGMMVDTPERVPMDPRADKAEVKPYVMPNIAQAVDPAPRDQALNASLIESDYQALKPGTDADIVISPAPYSQIKVTAGKTGTNPSNEAAANALTADDDAASLLPEDTERKLVDLVRNYFQLSYEYIEQRYTHWHEAEIAHDVYVPASQLDQKSKSNARTRNGFKPRLVDVIKTPFSRAINDTICTYFLAIFGGNPAFKIEPAGKRGNRQSAKILETELHYNMRRIGWESKLYQMVLDGNRYGMAPTANFWGSDGNAVVNLDPYSYFPDPRVTAQNRHESEFVGWRHWASMSALRRRNQYSPAKLALLETSKPATSWECNQRVREAIRGQSVDQSDPTRPNNMTGAFQMGSAHVLNTLYLWFDPHQVNIPAPFGLYRIIVADEKHIVRFDTAPYPHGGFPITHAEIGHDAHKTFAQGGYDLMMPLQRFQDWLLRARVENVQAIIANRLVADPTKVNINDILTPNAARLIRTLPGQDPNTAFKTIEIADATRSYWSDLDATGQLMQRLMAANDTAQGVQTETGRTATEIARLTSLGQQRLGTSARLFSATAVRPMVRQMIANLQAFGIEGGYVQLPAPFNTKDEGWYQWSQSEILGEYDYAIVDGTLPVDPMENSDSIRRGIELLVSAQAQGYARDYDINLLVERQLQAWGWMDPSQFKYKEGQQSPPPFAPPQNQVMPDGQIAQQLQAGNLVPAAQAQAMGAVLPPGAIPQAV